MSGNTGRNINGKKCLGRAAALLLAALLVLLSWAAAGIAEEKVPGMLTDSFGGEVVLPSTLPPGYFAYGGKHIFCLRDAGDVKVDGKWQTKAEAATVLTVERIEERGIVEINGAVPDGMT